MTYFVAVLSWKSVFQSTNRVKMKISTKYTKKPSFAKFFSKSSLYIKSIYLFNFPNAMNCLWPRCNSFCERVFWFTVITLRFTSTIYIPFSQREPFFWRKKKEKKKINRIFYQNEINWNSLLNQFLFVYEEENI